MMQRLNKAKEDYEAVPAAAFFTHQPAALALQGVLDLRELRAIVATAPKEVALAAIDERLVDQVDTFIEITAEANQLLGAAVKLARELRRPEEIGGASDRELAEACLRDRHPATARDAHKAFFADIFGATFGKGEADKGAAQSCIDCGVPQDGLVGSRLIGAGGIFPFVSLAADVDRAASMIVSAAKVCGAAVAREIAESIGVAARKGEPCDTVLPILRKHIEGQASATEAPQPAAPVTEQPAPEEPVTEQPSPEPPPLAPAEALRAA